MTWERKHEKIPTCDSSDFAHGIRFRAANKPSKKPSWQDVWSQVNRHNSNEHVHLAVIQEAVGFSIAGRRVAARAASSNDQCPECQEYLHFLNASVLV